jgi:hypothetical protein
LDILNNREWALVIWFFIFVFFVLFSPKMKNVRESFKHILNAFFVKAIITTVALMMIYITLIVFGLFRIGLWELNQFKNTIIWAISVGALSLFRITSTKEDPHFLRKLVLDNLKLIAIVKFVVDFYTLGLFIELMLVPFFVVLGGMLALAPYDKEYHQVQKFLNGIMVILGVILIFHSIYMLATNFGEFAKKQTIYDFYVPPLLTFLYLPFLFIMKVLITYEQAFLRLQYYIKNSKVRRFAKIYSTFNFHFRVKLLERWVTTLPFEEISSKEGIVKSVKQIFKMVSVEKDPPKVPLQKGWSPYMAKQFLLSEGLGTDYYHPIGQQEWYASSVIVKVGNDVITNTISYNVNGNETIANSLEIILNVFSCKSALTAHSKLLSSVRTLLKAALDLDVSNEIEAAIMKGKNQVFKLGSFIATIEKHDWQQKPSMAAYSVIFVLSMSNSKHIDTDQ